MQRFTLGIALIAATACGDNSDKCGPGTTNVNNVCVPSVPCGPGTQLDPSGTCVPDGSVVCTDGTKFEPITGGCVVDPNACRDGTVLVAGSCQDPTAGLVIDVEEGPEPNGLGIIESSTGPAGIVAALKPVGGTGIVLHGFIAPFHDVDGDGLLDPDVDTYLVRVTGPTLLRVTADGVSGVLGAFAVFAHVDANDPLFGYLRVGLSLTGDTSKRELLLPRAGEYLFAIGDSRTFFQYTTGGPIDAAPAGGEYYVTIEQLEMPTPEPLAAGTLQGMIAPDETKLYAPAAGSGANLVTLGSTYAQLDPGLALIQNGTPRAIGRTQILAGGIFPGDTTILAVDPIYNTANGVVPFTLQLETSTATPLATDGSAVAPVTEQRNAAVTTSHDFLTASQFAFDSTQAGQVFGIDLAWTQPVRGTLYDADFVPLGSVITPLAGPVSTWTGYHGLVRVPAPGRYYFVVVDPAGTPGTTGLGVTSTISPIATTAIALGTPTGDTALDATFHTAAFGYDTTTTHPWQLVDATGANTGGQTVAWFPASTYGRFDPVTTTAGAQPGPAPLYAHAFPEGGGPVGRILLDDPTTSYFLRVDATTTAASQTTSVAITDRDYVDLGTINTNTSASATDRMLDATNAGGRFLFRTSAGHRATITAHPQVPASLDTRFVRVDSTEAPASAIVDTSSSGDDSELIVQGHGGWTAFVVDAATPPASAQLYDVSVAVQPAVAYARTSGTTAFADACATGVAVPLAAAAGDPTDEGLTAALAAPAGFTFYGLAAPAFRVSSNGWLSFGPVADAAFENQHLPDPAPPNAVVAAYWSDLFNSSVCYLASGTRVIVQWDATSYAGGAVHAQAILDGADGSIELVWAATETALGASATIGLEDWPGANASVHAVDQNNAITAGSSKRFSPM